MDLFGHPLCEHRRPGRPSAESAPLKSIVIMGIKRVIFQHSRLPAFGGKHHSFVQNVDLQPLWGGVVRLPPPLWVRAWIVELGKISSGDNAQKARGAFGRLRDIRKSLRNKDKTVQRYLINVIPVLLYMHGLEY